MERRRMIYLTSFFKSGELPEGVVPWSAAVYQPKGYKYPKADWTDIRDETGKWTRPREFLAATNPAEAYFEAMLDHYKSRQSSAEEWLWQNSHVDCALCCWCPYDRAAQRQLKEFGSFICHTGPVGEFLYSLGAEVVYDEDRERMYR
jgi:hypothetical protein